MIGLRQTPIRRVLHRHHLFLGGERELVMVTGLACVTLVLTMNMVAIVVAAVVWFPALFAFRMMAKADPQMARVFLRYRKYQGYYPARSRPYGVR